ncbi:PAS domain S-box-containing protein [Skermanella aerolata]|uniref:ATP-binding protein n=1 Tax=Skermanella aerolata TaxID=393310 RepID=UPI003D20EAFE
MSATFLSLIQSAGLLGLVLVFYSGVLRRFDVRPWRRQAACGLLFGGGTVLTMLVPIHISPGVVIDARAIMLGLAAPFGGIGAATIAALISGAFRLFGTGGIGALAGVAGIAMAVLAGVLFDRLPRKLRLRFRTASFAALGLLISCNILSLLLLPSWEDALQVLSAVGLPLVVINVGGTVVFGILLSREQERMGILQALRTSEARYRAIIDTAADAIVTARGEGELTAFNSAAERLFGHKAADVLGRDIRLLLPEAERFIQDSFTNRQVRGLHRDGTALELELSLSAWRGSGDRRFITCIIRDVAERNRIDADLKLAKETAESANRAKGQFLAELSHELRSPLNAVIGFADMIRSEVAGPLGSDRYREWAGDIRDSGQHLLGLINEILDHAKAEAGRLAIGEEEVDLAETVKFCIRMMEPRATRARITLSATVAPEVATIRGDEKRLRQILLNLLTNGVKYTPSGGQVTVTAQQDGDGGLFLTVSDTGIGIAKDDLSHMFEAFWRADSVGTGKVEGTGLGLTLTRRLVGLHEGTIEMTSVAGQGTTATVRLPRHRVLSQAPELSGEPATPSLDILLVEDDAIIRLTTQMMLTRWGHQVVGAAHANEALETLQSDRPIDLLFSDIVIPPGMSGAELAKVAGRLRPGIKVLLTSGFAGHTVASDISRDYLMVAKPYDYVELQRKIAAAMDDAACR